MIHKHKRDNTTYTVDWTSWKDHPPPTDARLYGVT